jgi:hypothetical protein
MAGSSRSLPGAAAPRRCGCARSNRQNGSRSRARVTAIPLSSPTDASSCLPHVGTDSGEAFSLHLGSLDGNTPPRLLLDNASGGLYAAGHLLFLRGSTLMARPFDIDRLDFSGEEVSVAETIALSPSLRAGALSVSDTGLLAYQTSVGTVRSQLIWHNRDGRPLQKVAEPLDQTSLELSPDGTRALVSVALARTAITRCRSQPPVATSRAGAATAKRSST